jgi:hypothetical protein
MSKVLLQLADESFLVSQETAQRVQRSLPADRFVTVTSVREAEPPLLSQRKPSTVFERHQPKLTDKEQEYVKRFARHLTKSKQPKQKSS